jgi:hypothetical protein
MPRLRQYLLVFSIFVLGVVNLFAANCGSITGVGVCWYPPVFSKNGTFALNPANCSQTDTSMSPCGAYYASTGNGYSLLGSGYGWHNYVTSDGNPQTWLNNTLASGTGLSFTLTGAANFSYGDSSQYKHPAGDNGYYLSAANTSNTPAITITFTGTGTPNGIKEFALYWGSVDTWNTVTFTSSSGTYTFSGSQLPNIGSSINQSGGNGNTSLLVDFSVPSGYKPWTSISFTSCDSNGNNCNPAFEFDNIEWKAAQQGCCSVTPGSNSPVPESSSLMLLCTGLTSAAEWLRRKARR